MADFEWVNNGTVQDISDLAIDSMWCTSQAAGNRQSLPDKAMTAPGSDPVDRELKTEDMADPHVNYSGGDIPVGTSGKPQPAPPSAPGPPRWGKTTVPDVVRKKLGDGRTHA
jgi:hypothetical protein